MLCTPVRARIGQPSSDGSCETAIHTKCASNAQGRLEQGQLDRDGWELTGAPQKGA